MSERPFMQLYVSDFIGDTLHLSTEQIGAYMLLLMAMWNAGGRLPNDDAKLARVARLSVKKWKGISADLMPFFTVDGDTIGHNRLTKELQKSESKSQSRASAGAAGGTAKALKDKEARVANAMPELQHLPDTITREESFSLRSKETRAPAAPTPRSELLSCLDADHAQAVIDHRRRIGKSLTAHAAKLLAGKFGRCPDPNAAADAMIANGWQGFEPEWLENRAMPRGQSPPQLGADGLARDAQGRVSMADYTSQILRKMEQQGHDGRTIEGSYERRDGDGTEPSFPLLGA